MTPCVNPELYSALSEFEYIAAALSNDQCTLGRLVCSAACAAAKEGSIDLAEG